MESFLTLKIPEASDLKYGWLSNSSMYSFKLEDKEWPSVDHYLLAKLFEGTVLEEKIRKAKNVFAAKQLTRPKRFLVDGKPKILYCLMTPGSSKEPTIFYPRDDWKDVGGVYMKNAMCEKFKQNLFLKKKLLLLRGITFLPTKSGSTDAVVSILTYIRDQYFDDLDISPGMLMPNEDILAKTSSQEELLLKSMFQAITWVRDKEGMDEIYTEMIDDVLYNYIPAIGIKIANDWIKTIEWSIISKQMPRFEKLMTDVRLKFEKLNSKGTESQNKKSIIMVCAVIRWLRMGATFEEKRYVGVNIDRINEESIVLQKKYRDYRKCVPSKISEVSSQNESVSDGTFKKAGAEIYFDFTKFGIDLVVINKGSYLELKGKGIDPKFKAEILRNGDENLEATPKSLIEITDIIFDRIPEKHKSDLAYGVWVIQVTHVIHEIYLSIHPILTSHQFNFVVTLGDVTSLIISILNFNADPSDKSYDVIESSRLDKKKVSFVPKDFTEAISNITKPLKKDILADASFQQYWEALNKINNWSRKEFTGNIDLAPSDRSNATRILVAIDHIINVLTSSFEDTTLLEKEAIPIAIDIICPSIHKKRYRKYKEILLKKISEDASIFDLPFDESSTQKIVDKLKFEKIFSDVITIRKFLDPHSIDAKNEENARLNFSWHDVILISIFISFSEKSDGYHPINFDDKSINVMQLCCVSDFQDEDTDVRGGMYIRLFSPHKLRAKQYSSLIDILEFMTGEQRDLWLDDFVKKDLGEQRSAIDALLAK